MKNILSKQQFKALESLTLNQDHITTLDLISRAAKAFEMNFRDQFPVEKFKFLKVVCGTGNNGADGMAIASSLNAAGYQAEVYSLKPEGCKQSEAYLEYEKRFREQTPALFHELSNDLPAFQANDFLIDAIFGIGLNREPADLYKNMITTINNSGARVIAVDVPSGLNIDGPTNWSSIVQADFTYTFENPKFSFFPAQNYKYVGEFTVLPIGLNAGNFTPAEIHYSALEADDISKILAKKPIQKFDHKGKRGTALVVAGSIGKHGAAVLTAKGALKTGVGKLFVHIPRSGVDILQTLVPEALVDIDDNTEVVTVVKDPELFQAIGIGPGIGTSGLTRDLLSKLFATNPKNLVLDADALNILATDKDLWTKLPAGSILTPHIKEFARLCPEEVKDDYDRLAKLSAMALEKKSVIILKGAHSAIATPDGHLYFNTTGNPGMAKAGMGDVLTGMLTSLLAMGFNYTDSSLAGVYLHGLAADLAIKEIWTDALSPLDLVEYIGPALKSVR